MKRKILLLISLTLWLGCSGVYHLKKYNHNVDLIDDIEHSYNLSVKILSVSEKNSYNKIKVSYEITNNSGKIFENSKSRYYAFFIVRTKSGKEIGDYRWIFKRIPAGVSIILNDFIDIALYEFDSISASIYIK